MAETLSIACRRSLAGLKQLSLSALPESQGDWSTVEPALVARTPGLSPFNVENSLAQARKTVVLFGQNMNYVASNATLHVDIERFLSEDRDRLFQVNICDPDDLEAAAVWASVNPTLEHGPNNYGNQLRKGCAGLLQLSRNLEQKGLNGFSLRAHRLLPFGAVAVDPHLPSGAIALHPVINHIADAARRPQFVLTRKRNSGAGMFDQVWEQLRFVANQAPVVLAGATGPLLR